jgi:hypothetical protein
MASVVNINEVLEGHVSLEVECLDRLYLNAYCPVLQVPGQVVTFLTGHLGYPIPSPALFQKIGNRFRREVDHFAAACGIPVLHLKKPDRSRWDDRKLDHVRPHLDHAAREGRFGVAAIVVAQEYQWVTGAGNRSRKPGVASYDFVKEERRVNAYYFYVHDRDFGPGFIKICSYFPYPAKVRVNGHERARRQAAAAGIAFTEPANGFASCDDPAALQAICDRLGPADVQAFSGRWTAVIPAPFTRADRAAGYWRELSMRQVEASRALVFDDPRRARGFFEALVTDNIGIGRPREMAAVSAARPHTKGPHRTKSPYRTRVFSPGTEVKMDVVFKHSRIKQYLKQGRAYRIETVISKPADLGVLARIEHLPELTAKARAASHRLLRIERAGQGCAIGTALFERTHQPCNQEGQRTGALRFGDHRAMALAGALCLTVHAVTGLTNRSLRGHVAGLPGTGYTANQMSYDLRRLRLHGLIQRIPGTHTYTITPDGIRVAIFYTKLQHRLLAPLLAASAPPAAPQLRAALATIDHAIAGYVTNARLAKPA